MKALGSKIFPAVTLYRFRNYRFGKIIEKILPKRPRNG
jgi:hypothetical protein